MPQNYAEELRGGFLKLAVEVDERARRQQELNRAVQGVLHSDSLALAAAPAGDEVELTAAKRESAIRVATGTWRKSVALGTARGFRALQANAAAEQSGDATKATATESVPPPPLPPRTESPAAPQAAKSMAERELAVVKSDISALEQRYTEQVDVVDKLTIEKQKLAAELHQTRMLVRKLVRQNATLAAAAMKKEEES